MSVVIGVVMKFVGVVLLLVCLVGNGFGMVSFVLPPSCFSN